MKRTKAVLIIGGSGFLGSHLAQRLRESYKVFATYYKHPVSLPGVTYIPFNVDNKNWVKRVLYTTMPEVVIYMAGSNQKDPAAKNMRRAELHHAVGPATIASTTTVIQPRFIFLSNSYVFEGTRGNYHETDTVLPSCILGKMKLGGENIIKSKCLNYIILRSSPVFGRGNGSTFSTLDRMRFLMDRNKRFEAATDEIHSYAPVGGLCDLVARLIESGIRNRVIHYGGLTKITEFDFAKSFAKHFKYDPSLIIPKAQPRKNIHHEEPTLDFSLNCTLAADILKIKPLLLEESFDLIQQQLIPL